MTALTIESLQEELQAIRTTLTQHAQGLPDILGRLAQSEQAAMTKITRAEAEQHFTALRVGLDQVSAQLQAQAASAGRSGHQRDPIPMTNRRSFDKLMGYGGHAEKFDDWRFKLVNFLEEESFYRGFLKELEQNKGVQITSDHLRALQNAREIGEEKPTTQWLDHHLYQVLVLNCSGEALAMVKTRRPWQWLKRIRTTRLEARMPGEP